MLKDQLRKARKAAGKTQKAVADYLNITESTYCGYETGKRQPDALKIKKIAAYLGVTGDFLLETGMDDTTDRQLQDSGSVFCENAEEVSLIVCYRSLNAAGKTAAVSALEGIAANPAFREESSNTVTA